MVEQIHNNNNFGTIPKWVWNTTLSEINKTEIYTQLKNFSEKDHYSGVMIVLWNIDGYMTEEYFEKYGYALEAARDIGINIVIWDENGFPSGYAGGKIEELYPQYTAKRLDMIEYHLVGDENIEHEIRQGFEGAVAFNKITKERIDISTCFNDNILKWTAPIGEWQVMIFYCTTANYANGFFKKFLLVDYLNENAVKKFIELTHQCYYNRFENYFGNVIKYAFYDEPSFWHVEGGRIWTSEFKNKFQQKHGFSPVSLYPALWFDIGEDTAWARNMLFSFRADLYANEYIGTLSKWCDDHRIELTGHMDQEEIINPVSISGDLFKVFKNQHIPGIDEINFYGRASYAYKIVSSAAVCYDKERVMCEVFGAMGEEMPAQVLMKEAIDMLTKGINFFVPHGTWYSNAPEKVTFPPELSYRSNKFASSLLEYNNYARNCCALLSSGRLVTDIAVLYPIHDLQAQYHFNEGNPYNGGVNPEYSDYLKLGETLSLELRHDYVFIHPDILDEKCRVTNNILYLDNEVNFQQFKIVIIPGMEVISLSNLKKISEFFDQGGVVISTSRCPLRSVEQNSNHEINKLISHIFGSGTNQNKNGGKAFSLSDCNAESLKAAFDKTDVLFDVSIRNTNSTVGGNLSYIHKVKGAEDIIFVGNSSDNDVEMELVLHSLNSPIFYDPHTGEKSVSSYSVLSQKKDNSTLIKLHLPAVKSMFIISKR